MAFYVFRWYCQIIRPSANKIAALRLRIFKTQNIKHCKIYLILRFFINPFPYFGGFFLRFDDFKQRLDIF